MLSKLLFFKMTERTLVIIKPDAMKRKLNDEIIKRYTNVGLKIVARKTVHVNKELAEKHYPDTDSQVVGMGNKTIKASKEAGTPEIVREIFGTEHSREIGLQLRAWLIESITASPVDVMVLEGKNAIEEARRITGFTDPFKADKGTIRGDFGDDAIHKANSERRATRNLVHASGDLEEAKRELNVWKEIFS